MNLPGGAELVIILFVLCLVLIPIWGALDAAMTPDSRWQAADQSKLTWVLLQLVGILGFVVVGSIATAFYVVRIRPQLRQDQTAPS